MTISIHPSALKHGIKENDILHASSWAQWIEPLDEETHSVNDALALTPQDAYSN